MTHRRPFRFGLLGESVRTRAQLIDIARAAEAAGYATFLLRDHFVDEPFGHQLAPLTALATVAATTDRLRVGTLVLDNDYRHPVVLAKEAATLDLLSGGRLELGLGAGWLRDEYERAGLPFDPAGVRIGRLEEAIRVLKGLFADGPLSFAGDHYEIANLEGFPKPAQRPHPPLLVGGGGKRILTLAGREADAVGILTTSVGSGTVVDDPAERSSARVAEKVGWVRDGAGERFPEIELSLVPSFIVTDNRRRDTDEFVRQRGWVGVSVEQAWDMPAVFIGSAEQIVEQMLRQREALGFSYYVVSDRDARVMEPVVARLAGR
jgi:probable F420-dependent oxidoreductase